MTRYRASTAYKVAYNGKGHILNDLEPEGNTKPYHFDEFLQNYLLIQLDDDQCYRCSIFDAYCDGIDLRGDDYEYCAAISDEMVECKPFLIGSGESMYFPKEF